MKKFLILFLLVFIGLNASASNVTFTDNFSGYTNYYQVFVDTNNTTGWTSTGDANNVVLVNPLIGKGALKIPVDVSKDASNQAILTKTLAKKFDITDFNANGRIYTLISIDNNANMASITLRLGQSTSNYYQWNTTTPYGDTYYLGKNLIKFDFNNANGITGSPINTDINWVQIVFNYGAPQIDFNITFDRIWVEKSPNAFNGVWNILYSGNYPHGAVIPFSYNEGNGLSLTDVNKFSLGNHGRVFIKTLDQYNLPNYYLNIQADLNQIDTNWGTRFLFDTVNFSPGDNFSSCFINDINNSTGRYVGVEQWIDGNRNYSQTTTNFPYNGYNKINCSVIGTTAKVYVDDVLIHTGDLNYRIDGSIGFESYKGISHFKNVNITLLDTTASSGINTSSNLYEIIFSLLLPLGFLLSILGIVVYQQPSLSVLLAEIITLFVTYIILHALIFGA